MMRKKIFLKIAVFLLVVTISSYFASSQNISGISFNIILNISKENYLLGEEVLIKIESSLNASLPQDLKLTIASKDSSLHYLGYVPNEIKFIPSSEGPYTLELDSNGTLIATGSFTVGQTPATNIFAGDANQSNQQTQQIVNNQSAIQNPSQQNNLSSLDGLNLTANYTSNITPEIAISKNLFSPSEDANFDFEYLTKQDLVRQNKWKDEFEIYEKNTNKTRQEIDLLKQKTQRKIPQGKKWQAPNETIEAFVLDSNNGQNNVGAQIEQLRDGKFSIRLSRQREFKAGRYTLKVNLIKDGVAYASEQNFTWGVLAVNTNKSVYLPNEDSFIGIGILDDFGKMVCNSSVTLEITSPSNIKKVMTTDGDIKVSPECTAYGVTNLPDYYASYTVGEIGTYVMNLTASTPNGIRSINDSFEVRNKVAFDVARLGPTRIYPPVAYAMNFTINANQNYNGPVREYVPASFEITPQSGMDVSVLDGTKTLTWDMSLIKGSTYNIGYVFKAPPKSPEFYVLGPLDIGTFSEARQWQIAGDSPIQNFSIFGVLVYGKKDYPNPVFRVWNGTNFSIEQDSGINTGLLNWTVVKAASKKNEYMAVMENSSGALIAMVYNGTCWSNGTACNFGFVIANGSVGWQLNTSVRGFDVAYMNLSGMNDQEAIIAYSNMSDSPSYTVWNSTNKTFTYNGPITNTFRNGPIGWIDLIEMASSAGGIDNEIALLMRHEVQNTVSGIIWNATNSTWGCNQTISTTLESATSFKDFGGAYQKSSRKLFVATSETTANIRYANKTLNKCEWDNTSGTIGSTVIGAVMDVEVDEARGNNTCIAMQDASGARNVNYVYFGNSSFSMQSPNDTTSLANPGSPKQIVACGGFGNGTLAVYSDAASTTIDYYLFPNSTMNWTPTNATTTGNTGYHYVANPAIGSRWNNFLRQFPSQSGVSNMTLLFYTDSTGAFNVQLFNSSIGNFSSSYSNIYGSALEPTISSTSTMPFDFAFNPNQITPSTFNGTVSADILLSNCSSLTSQNTYYHLIKNANSGGTCFNVMANGITIDCHGLAINYSQTTTGYGINISGFNGTTIKGCNIVQASPAANSFGISVFSYSDDHFIFNNTISTVGLRSSAISINTNCTGTNISNNVITTKGTNSSGIFFNNSVDASIVYGNNISTFNTSSSGIFLLNNIYNNTFYDNNITANNNTFSFGIFMLRYVSNNTFYRNSVSSLTAGIVINGSQPTFAGASSFNNFTNDTIVPCLAGCAANYKDIVLTANASSIVFTNVSMNKSRISIIPHSFAFPREKDNLTVRWYLDLNVTNSSDNSPISGAEVSINNSFGSNIFDGLTNANGRGATQVVTEFVMNGSLGNAWTASNDSCFQLKKTLVNHNLTCFTPYNISVNISGYYPTSASIDVNRSKALNLSDSIAILPNVTLINPANASLLKISPVLFEYVPQGNFLDNCSLYSNFTGAFGLNQTNFTINPGVVNNFSVSNLSRGTYLWNVKCTNSFDNLNFSQQNFTFKMVGDLLANSTDITLSNPNPVEFENITINATVLNLGFDNATNVIVEFVEYADGNSVGIGNKTINITGLGNQSAAMTWIAKLGNTTISVNVDPPIGSGLIQESDETNNQANVSVYVPAYHTYFGFFKTEFVLGSSQNTSLLTWFNDSQSNILATDSDSSINFASLKPLGRNATGNVSPSSKDDFEDLDLALNLTNVTANINSTWTAEGLPKVNYTFSLLGSSINNSPVVNSTNNSNFITGILWDTSDANIGSFNGSQDVVFITLKNSNKLGISGYYDYELKVPANLRKYIQPNTLNSITIYAELT